MRIVFVLVFFLLTLVLNAQTNTYLADLSALKAIVEQTASFKAQIKENKLSDFNALYNRLASDTTSNPNSYKYFYNLSQLLFPLRDNHLGFYQLPYYNYFETKESIDNFIDTKEFIDYPYHEINIDSLKAELIKKPADSIEGIYYYDKFYSVGLFRYAQNEYIGVIVDSDTRLWPKGQIAVHLYEYRPNLYKAIYGHPLRKHFLLQPNERYQHQSLVNSYFYESNSHSIYSKQRLPIDHINLSRASPRFELKTINENVQYLLIRTFAANKTIMQESQRFYDSIQRSLKASHVILDLRNNEGGADKEMKKYLKLLKRYVKSGHVYVLLNNGTLSQAEIFTVKLKKLKNITTVGQTTKGMLAYGSNYGKWVKLPSGRFEIYPTDMNSNSKLLPYEDYGINPDIVLRNDRNWVEQVIEIIQKK